jgi:hypothetical protein
MQQNGTGVLDACRVLLPLGPNKASDSVGQTKFEHYLIYHMASQIINHSSTRKGFRFPACSSRLWAIPVKMGFKLNNSSKDGVVNQVRQGKEIRIPPAVFKT